MLWYRRYIQGESKIMSKILHTSGIIFIVYQNIYDEWYVLFFINKEKEKRTNVTVCTSSFFSHLKSRGMTLTERKSSKWVLNSLTTVNAYRSMKFCDAYFLCYLFFKNRQERNGRILECTPRNWKWVCLINIKSEMKDIILPYWLTYYSCYLRIDSERTWQTLYININTV